MINGNELIMQFAIEEDGDFVGLKVASEAFNTENDRKDEGVLTGGIGPGKKETMSLKSNNSFSTLAKPDVLGYFLACALGVEKEVEEVTNLEENTIGYTHTFMPLRRVGNLPSMEFQLDRVAQKFKYSGLKIKDFSLTAEPEDYLKLDINLFGNEEEKILVLDNTDVSASTLKSFKFSGGKVKINGETFCNVTSVKLEYANNLPELFTTCSGMRPLSTNPGMREIKVDLEVLYDKNSEELRDHYLEDSLMSCELEFESSEVITVGEDLKYKLVITLPALMLEESRANFGGADTITQNLSMVAVEGTPVSGYDPLITIKLTDKHSTVYITNNGE